MAEFVVNADVVTDKTLIEVTVDPRKPLAPGRHSFRLIVVDDSGNKSLPDQVEVIVADQDNPTAVIKAPKVVAIGKSFDLDGSASFDVGGGKIESYVWTYLGQA